MPSLNTPVIEKGESEYRSSPELKRGSPELKRSSPKTRKKDYR